MRGRALLAGAVGAGLLGSACASTAPSTLDPSGASAASVVRLWWFMFAVSAAVVAVVGALILVGIRRRRRAPTPVESSPRWSSWLVAGGGVVFPLVALAVLWVLTLQHMMALSEPAGPTSLTVEVVGYRWWWEVRYPDHGIVTANEVHVPIGVPVRLRLRTEDVIHSFWVPQLAPKMDMIAGRVNETWLRADRVGVYRGQCAEFCGLQHALMIFHVVAEPPAQFREWVARERAPAPSVSEPLLRRGREVFAEAACSACHTIRGVSTHPPPGTTRPGRGALPPQTAVPGPDLTHFGSRLTLGAGAAPNTRGYLGGWIADSQAIKPGNLMPPMQLSSEDLQALIAYLESLE